MDLQGRTFYKQMLHIQTTIVNVQLRTAAYLVSRCGFCLAAQGLNSGYAIYFPLCGFYSHLYGPSFHLCWLSSRVSVGCLLGPSPLVGLLKNYQCPTEKKSSQRSCHTTSLGCAEFPLSFCLLSFVFFFIQLDSNGLFCREIHIIEGFLSRYVPILIVGEKNFH